ncbi:hypothetical protein DPSP01_004260 [Paraphaeosphaeria sporulosa]
MGPIDSPKCVLAVLILWLSRRQSDHHDSFVESKTSFAPVFATALSKFEREKPTSIILDVAYKESDFLHDTTTLKISWDGKVLIEQSYGNWEGLAGYELSNALGGQGPFNIRDVIQLLDIENGEEILGLIAGVMGLENAAGDVKQAAILSHTRTPEHDVWTWKEEIGFGAADPVTTAKPGLATEPTIDGREGDSFQAQRGLPLLMSGLKHFYVLFALLGNYCILEVGQQH